MLSILKEVFSQQIFLVICGVDFGLVFLSLSFHIQMLLLLMSPMSLLPKVMTQQNCSNFQTISLTLLE